MAVTIKDEKIMDSWGTIMEGAQGKSDFILETTKHELEESEAPWVSWDITDVAPGMFKGFFGKKREYLRVINQALKDHRMYIGARDYGNNLDVSWYLTVEPGLLKKLTSKALFSGSDKALSYALDIFDQQDLQAYVTVVHHCLLRAVESLMNELNQDFSKINRKSKGFLEVW